MKKIMSRVVLVFCTILVLLIMLTVYTPSLIAGMPDWSLEHKSNIAAENAAKQAADQKLKEKIFEQQAMIIDTAVRSGKKSGIQAIADRFNVDTETAGMLFNGAMKYFINVGEKEGRRSDQLRSAELATGTVATATALVSALTTGGTTAFALGTGKISGTAAVAGGASALTAIIAFGFKAAALAEECAAHAKGRKVNPGAKTMDNYSNGFGLVSSVIGFDILNSILNPYIKAAAKRGYADFKKNSLSPQVLPTSELSKPYPVSDMYTEEYLKSLKNTKKGLALTTQDEVVNKGNDDAYDNELTIYISNSTDKTVTLMGDVGVEQFHDGKPFYSGVVRGPNVIKLNNSVGPGETVPILKSRVRLRKDGWKLKMIYSVETSDGLIKSKKVDGPPGSFIRGINGYVDGKTGKIVWLSIN